MSANDIKKLVDEKEAKFIDYRFTNTQGKEQHVTVTASEDGIETIANLANDVNSSVENIGARRLHTIIERVLDEISFTATDRSGEKIVVDSDYVKKNLGQLVKDNDLSKFIL